MIISLSYYTITLLILLSYYQSAIISLLWCNHIFIIISLLKLWYNHFFYQSFILWTCSLLSHLSSISFLSLLSILSLSCDLASYLQCIIFSFLSLLSLLTSSFLNTPGSQSSHTSYPLPSVFISLFSFLLVFLGFTSSFPYFLSSYLLSSLPLIFFFLLFSSSFSSSF